jgi:hypothetical protein
MLKLEIIVPNLKALHAYKPLLLAVKTGQAQNQLKIKSE